MRRREFLKFSATGLTVVAVGSMADWPLFWRGSQARAATLSLDQLDLEMVAVDAEMVDGVLVPMWAFKINGEEQVNPPSDTMTVPRIPGPAMVALTGDLIRLRIKNNIVNGGAHSFAIPGVLLPVSIPSGQRVDIEFTAPAPGTYVYLDPENAPVNRMMGLHGVLAVLPNPLDSNTPYLNPTLNIQRMFDDLGTADHFRPGAPWDSTRNAIWVFNVIDRDRCIEAAASPTPIPANRFARSTDFLPQYFTLNGKSGFFAAQHLHDSAGMDDHGGGDGIFSVANAIHDLQSNISIKGFTGQPMLIRTINAGNFWHSPHNHGNHVYPLSHANYLQTGAPRQLLTNLTNPDTWTLAPGDIVDVLLPFIQPPDIPANFWERAASGENDELFPLLYPMHDHNEITNTAAGGNYPHGIATHWQIDGIFDPANPAMGVIFVDRADVRVRTGQLIIEGRFTVPSPNVENPIFLVIHGGGVNGPMISDRVRVGIDGSFRFRGRSLKAMASRFVTLTHHDELDVVHAIRTVPLRLR